MTRKNIFEILASKYDFQKEFRKIVKLFNTAMLVYTNPLNFQQTQGTIEQMVDSYAFVNWKQRGSCLNCDEMRHKIFISEHVDTTDEMVTILEYYLNLINLLIQKRGVGRQNINFQYYNEYPMLLSNIDLLLEHIHHEKKIFTEEEKVILIPKNPAATAVAEISSTDTAMAILKYHHASLKGQLAEKKDILRRIAQEYEPILDNPIDGFTDYFKTAKNMLNNLDIRHNNKAGKKKNNLVTNLTNEELEKWYDEIYQLLLFCVLAKDNKERKNKMAEFLKGLKEKK